MNKKTIAKAIFISLASIAFSVPAPAQDKKAPPKAMDGQDGKGWCEERCQEFGKMKEEMKSQDSELQTLLDKMNSASGDQKVQFMSDIVNRLVQQRLAMHSKMGRMKKGMGGCPLMRDDD